MISCKLRKFYNFGNGEQYHHDQYKMNDDIYVKLEIDFFFNLLNQQIANNNNIQEIYVLIRDLICWVKLLILLDMEDEIM